MRILVVKFQIKPEFREEFLKLAIDDARGSNHDEPGCFQFDVVQDDADPNCIYFYEVYVDDAAFEAHTQTPHYARYRDGQKQEWHAAPVEVARCRNVYPPDGEWKRAHV